MSNVYIDDDLYTIDLSQQEIILLYLGVIPYIALTEDPKIPDNELLFINQVEHPGDKFPILDTIPCKVLSSVCFSPDLYILTVKPDEIDLEFEQYLNELRVGMENKSTYLRTQAFCNSDSLDS